MRRKRSGEVCLNSKCEKYAVDVDKCILTCHDCDQNCWIDNFDAAGFPICNEGTKGVPFKCKKGKQKWTHQDCGFLLEQTVSDG